MGDEHHAPEEKGISDHLAFRPKGKIALAEIERIRKRGVRFGAVLTDAGYGACSEFRQGLTEMQHRWAVGVISTQKVYPPAARARCHARKV